MLIRILYFIFISQASLAADFFYTTGIRSENQILVQKQIENLRKVTAKHFERKHIGIEILTVGGFLERPESLLGHIGIRLVDEDQDPLNDTVITFQMLILDPQQKNEKGTGGGWPNYPIVTNLANFLLEYSTLDSRSQTRTVLPATPEMLKNFKLAIQRIQDIPTIVSDYKFFSNNCATASLKALSEVGYQFPKQLLEIPVAVSSLVLNSMNSYLRPIEIPTFATSLLALVKDAHIPGLQYMYFSIQDLARRHLANSQFISYLKTTKLKKDLAILVWMWPTKQHQFDKEMQDIFQNRQDVLEKYPLTYFIPTLAPALYRACALDDFKCREERFRALQDRPDLLDPRVFDFHLRWRAESKRSIDLIDKAKESFQIYLNSFVIKDMAQLSYELRQAIKN